MTDRELLELAAKAVGIKVNAARQAERDDAGMGHHGLWTTTTTNWNPLTDDGQALCLAVKLRITIDQSWRTKVEVVWRPEYQAFTYHVDLIGDGAPDREEATRRAIVRAAACIGKGMP